VYTQPDLQPSLADDLGWDTAPVMRRSKMREGAARIDSPLEVEVMFDDTFQVTAARIRNGDSRLMRHLREGNNGRFERGVPTNDSSSSRNYSDDLVKIIDGEHKSLMTLGKINEAMEDDDHSTHMLQHRMQLSDPHLSETARSVLLDHIADHGKKNRAKLKAVQAAASGKSRPDISRDSGYRQGLGMLSKTKRATTDDVIPQDSKVSNERKRTSGVMAMEARMARFDRAVGRAYGGGGSRRSL
jgi:hypothetical protein